ncbi:MAG: hypothetical protein AAF636_15620 [Pseudomonadota bacterium]
MVRGRLKFDSPESVAAGQRIRISVEDTSRAGASAETLVQKEVTIPENFDTGLDNLPFEIDLDENRDGLTLRAHMPRHDGEDIRSGDMITTASVPVRPDDDVDVTLRRI